MKASKLKKGMGTMRWLRRTPKDILEEEKLEKGRRELLYLSFMVILILGLAVVLYAFSTEFLMGLFSSAYINNVLRISFALLIIALIGYLTTRDRMYARHTKELMDELHDTSEELKDKSQGLSYLLEVSSLVAVPDDLYSRLEEKQPQMKDHWKKVSYYAQEIAKIMGQDDDFVRQVGRAAELMDIGVLSPKFDVRPYTKELTPRERELIRQHPVFGVNILNTLRPGWEILPLVRNHHEWFNGKGYPDRLKGEDIPFGARILSVADAFVAMTSSREYRDTFDLKTALTEIETCSGTQFDLKVTRAFQQLFRHEISMLENDEQREALSAFKEMVSI